MVFDPELLRHKIAIEHVYKSFTGQNSQVRALQDISFTVNEGEFVCIVGPSGCGKTTLLHLIAGLQLPDEGVIFDEGKPVTGPGYERMVMFQEPALFPWLNVFDNVLFSLKLKNGINKEEREYLCYSFLKMVGLERFLKASIHELSGGMKQRVALARALAPNPHVLLMDEPFGSLDAMTREQLYGDIQRIQQDQKKTIILVTHNVQEAVCLGDRVLLFSSNPGQLRKEISIDLPRFRDVRSLEVAEKAIQLTSILRSLS